MIIGLKRYQVAILFFAIGIFIATTIGLYIHNQREIILPEAREYKIVDIYFSNTTQNPDFLDCEKVEPVQRSISRLTDNDKSALPEYIYLAISELLKGPAQYEKDNGFFTSINEGTKLQNIILENEVVTVDFNEQLDKDVAGSCKVTAIRSQITNTLLQFEEIKGVIISVNGRTEDILQP